MPIRRSLPAALVLLAALSSPALAQTVCRVKPAGSGSQDGQSWDSAMRLQPALANTGCNELWVRSGRYRPTTANNRSISFVIRNNLKLYGGFAGTETARSQRRPSQHRTVLTGDIQLDDTVSSIGVTVDGDDIVGHNAYHVVVFDGSAGSGPIRAGTVLDGFTVTGGDAEDGSFGGSGAGIHCDGSGTGGICSPTLANLVIAGNRATQGGAGMHLEADYGGSGSPRLNNVTFSGNVDRSINSLAGGGALLISAMDGDSGEPTLTSVRFFNNRSGSDGGALHIKSGGTADLDVMIDQAHWRGNRSHWSGGGVKVRSFGSSRVDIRINNSLASNNSARSGGHVLANENHDQSRSVIRLINSTFTETQDNENTYEPISNLVLGDDARATLHLRHVTAHFVSDYREIISNLGNPSTRVELVNSTVWTTGETFDSVIGNVWGAVSHITRSLVQNGCPINDSLFCDLVPGNPRLSPLADNGGGLGTRMPRPDSPLIDAGTPTQCTDADQRGVARPQGAGCDLGAVEYVDMIFADGFESP